MFGWEFPPHISGGLGTACYGLTRGMAENGLDILFVIPKAYGDEPKEKIDLVGANKTVIKRKRFMQHTVWRDQEETEQRVETRETQSWEPGQTRWREVETPGGKDDPYEHVRRIDVDSFLLPYLTPEQFEVAMLERGLDHTMVRVDDQGKLVFGQEAILTEEQRKTREVVGQVREDWEELGEAGNFYEFTGRYGANLMQEVANFAVVAGEVAAHQEFDIIHAHDWLTYAAGVAAKRLSGKPLVVHVHATEFDRTGQNVNQQIYDLERMGMDEADIVITVSNLTRQIVIERYGIDPKKVFTVYNAVEPVEKAKVEFRKGVREKIVTFLGRITFQKGPEYFVEAANLLLQKDRDIRFVMAGTGDMMNKMIKRAAQLGISDKFHFPGFLKGDEVDQMFAMSDVYVMPSVSEPFGISPLEAMRSNVPVIISKQSGVSEILKHAIKIDFWDVNAMADAIYGLLRYDALSGMFSHHGKQEVDDLKWEKAGREVKDVYMTLFQKAAAAQP